MEKKICTLNKETLKIFTVCKVSCYHVKEMRGIDAWNFSLSEIIDILIQNILK